MAVRSFWEVGSGMDVSLLNREAVISFLPASGLEAKFSISQLNFLIASDSTSIKYSRARTRNAITTFFCQGFLSSGLK